MSKREALTRYSLIVSKVTKKPCTFKEIQEYLELQSEIQDANFRISKRTFNRDLADISSIFNKYIVYNPSKKAYEIEDAQADTVHGRMLEAFDVFNVLQLAEGMAHYIHFENRKPTGTDFMYQLMHAIKNHLIIRFQYQKFFQEEESERIAEVYALKEFRQRWYLLAKEKLDERIKLFALDRIKDIDVTQKKFHPPLDFNLVEYFRYSFGIIHHDGPPPAPVILSFTPAQGYYIKSLPLHHSQVMLVDNEVEYRISLQVHITHDFIMELMSHGAAVKVIAPQSLNTHLAELHQLAVNG